MTVGPSGIASADTPAFQLPFPCGQTWDGDSDDSSAHESYEIDFNRGSSADSDLYDTVTAAAAGTVVIASHQGDTNGYGNLVKIDHGDGWYTYYAHLSTMTVEEGDAVSQGQPIGSLGNTSRPGNNISPRLHFEIRYGDDYPANIQPAVFDGAEFGYPDDVVTSNSCSTPYDPAEVCGSGYYVIDTALLGAAGHVDLLWNGESNCVVTLKTSSVGSPTPTSAYLEPSGASRSTDSGDYSYYAGPESAVAPTCILWGGSADGETYDSPSEHC